MSFLYKKNVDTHTKLIRDFAEQWLEEDYYIFLRCEPGNSHKNIQVSYLEKRKFFNFELTEKHLPSIQTIYNAIMDDYKSNEISPIPKVTVSQISKHSSGGTSEYDDINALCINADDIKNCHYYGYEWVIPPKEYSDKVKQEFEIGKKVKSTWRSEYKISENTQPTKWDYKLYKFMQKFNLTYDKLWLTGEPKKSKYKTKTKCEGLQFTIYNDGSIYDEAIDPYEELNWLDKHGALTRYHIRLEGKLSNVKSKKFMIPPEPSRLGTPYDDEIDFVRHHDSDIKIVDRIIIRKNQLLRCVSVIHDNNELERETYIYKKLSI